MSIRYEIGLALEPGFTSRAYRSRQLICGQYASWAAEMNMVYLSVSGFFLCSDAATPTLELGLASVAEQSRRDDPQFSLINSGVDHTHDGSGHIFLDFAAAPRPPALDRLHGLVNDLLADTEGASPSQNEGFRPHLPLMLYTKLSASVFGDAVDFAKAVVADLQIPPSTQAWRLLLLRFESEAAGDDWSGGAWAADLRWELLATSPL